ncbi:arylformamidase [Jeotgalibacillus sp. R-1-5s-1]|uniref:arylformamidase n=1 Tax=Jeotgalibacillus sp. R-1-5s-1 TaxID=2555897 RepID=UPI00106CAD7E|nr:arylformamidase [Jeotgalibacillus sp. R-1-5s-1]TFD97686.1 arylformamidase [Jeotgalibacillus sp. R-1-5s-1]
MKIIDISMSLSERTAPWPGDTRFSYEVSWGMEESGSVNVGKLEMSAHSGTHIDAPFHFTEDGKKVHELEIDRYITSAAVVDVTGKETIFIEDLQSKLESKKVNAILLKTESWRDRSVFPEKIPVMDHNVPSFLADKGIRLIGLDLPSVDPIDNKELENHHKLLDKDIYILEGLVLDHVEEGVYELIALPLNIVGADGSPVRAILRK